MPASKAFLKKGTWFQKCKALTGSALQLILHY